MSDLSMNNLVLDYKSKTVEVVIKNNLLENIISYLNKDKRYFILSDDIVSKLYLDTLTKELSHFSTYIIPNGEKSKSTPAVLLIIEELIKLGFTKEDYLICLGGGVVTDLGAFVASIYKRAMNLILIPTTLLSQVDSAIGGKNGVDLLVDNLSYKNQIGTIYHPSIILIDPSLLKTLKNDDLLSGLGEVIKYGLCFDKEMFYSLFTNYSLDEVIKKCIKIKAQVTMEDEFEGSSRLILNFGHTIGHAIESLTNYKVPHGIAVAIGMLHEIKDEFIKSELIKLFELLGIEYQMKLNIDDLKKFILQDKKINNNEITIPKLIEIGKCELVKYNLDDYLGGY